MYDGFIYVLNGSKVPLFLKYFDFYVSIVKTGLDVTKLTNLYLVPVTLNIVIMVIEAKNGKRRSASKT